MLSALQKGRANAKAPPFEGGAKTSPDKVGSMGYSGVAVGPVLVPRWCMSDRLESIGYSGVAVVVGPGFG